MRLFSASCINSANCLRSGDGDPIGRHVEGFAVDDQGAAGVAHSTFDHGESASVPYALPSITACVAGAWDWNARIRIGSFLFSTQLAERSTNCEYWTLPSSTVILRPQRLRGPKRFGRWPYRELQSPSGSR